MSKRTLGTWSWVLAETGIVVVGILIAFSLNSWWEGRTAAAQERAHLSSLHTDFEQNVERLDALAEAQDRVSRASGDLLLIARGRASAPPDSIDGLIGEVFSSDQFDPVMGAYENLVNSGGLAQVRDNSLRSALASFAAMVDSRYAEEFSTALYLDFNREFMGRRGSASGSPRISPPQPPDPVTRGNLPPRIIASGSARGCSGRSKPLAARPPISDGRGAAGGQ